MEYKKAQEYIAIITYAELLLKNEAKESFNAFMNRYGFNKRKYLYVTVSCSENRVKSMLVILREKIIVAMIGVSPDIVKTLYPVQDVVKLFTTPPQTLYGTIECFLGSFIKPFSQSLHQKIRELLLQNPEITKLDFTGHSYGGMSVTVLSVIYEMLCRYHHGVKSENISVFIDEFYSINYGYLLRNSSQYSSFTAKLANLCNLEKDPQKVVIEKIKELDAAIFSKVHVSKIYAFGAPTVYTKEMVEVHNGLMGSRHLEWHISGDILAGLGVPGNSFAEVIKFLSKGKERCIPGLVFVIDDVKEKYGHLCEEYFEAMLNDNLPYHLVLGKELEAKKNELPRFCISITKSMMRSKRYGRLFIAVCTVCAGVVLISISSLLLRIY